MHSQAEETKPGFLQYGGGEVGGGDYAYRSDDIGQDLMQDYAAIALAEGFGGFDKFFFFQRFDLSSYHSGYIDPHGKPHGCEDLPEAFAKSKGDGDDKQYGGYRPDDIDEPHNDVVRFTAVIAGYCSEGYAYDDGDEYGNEAYGEGNSCADDEL